MNQNEIIECVHSTVKDYNALVELSNAFDGDISHEERELLITMRKVTTALSVKADCLGCEA